MTESASEANLTVAAIILIAAIVCVGTPLVRSLMIRQAWRACCTDQGGAVKGSRCEFYKDGEVEKSLDKDALITEKHTCIQLDENKED